MKIDDMEKWLEKEGFLVTLGRSNGKLALWERTLLEWLMKHPDKTIQSIIIGGRQRYIIVDKENK